MARAAISRARQIIRVPPARRRAPWLQLRGIGFIAVDLIEFLLGGVHGSQLTVGPASPLGTGMERWKGGLMDESASLPPPSHSSSIPFLNPLSGLAGLGVHGRASRTSPFRKGGRRGISDCRLLRADCPPVLPLTACVLVHVHELSPLHRHRGRSFSSIPIPLPATDAHSTIRSKGFAFVSDFVLRASGAQRLLPVSPTMHSLAQVFLRVRRAGALFSS